jgi:hypothetical protein
MTQKNEQTYYINVSCNTILHLNLVWEAIFGQKVSKSLYPT